MKWISFETAFSKDITGFDNKVLFVGDFKLNFAWNDNKKEIGSFTFKEDFLVGLVFESENFFRNLLDFIRGQVSKGWDFRQVCFGKLKIFAD